MPAEIEAKLSGKIAAYERTFAERAGTQVLVAILAKAGSADSVRAASAMEASFRVLDANVVVNLGMARKQNLRLRSDLLKLARIVE